MNGIMLFGLRLSTLLAAIAEVETNSGATSPNVYQIRSVYVDDVNRIYKANYSHFSVLDPAKSIELMVKYWMYYGEIYRRETGLAPTYEVLARIHNGGPDGWRKRATKKYWEKVRCEMFRKEGGV